MKRLIPIFLALGLTLTGCAGTPAAPNSNSSSSKVAAPDSENGTDYPEDAAGDGGTDAIDENATDGDDGTDDTGDVVATYTIPDVVGMIDGEAQTALKSDGYMGSFDFPENMDGNPRQSCLMNHTGPIMRQFPAAGTEVENAITTKIKFVVDCRFR